MNKKINVGVVGLHFGHEIITDHLIGGEAAPYFRLAAVCDRIQDKADAIAARYGVSACYGPGYRDQFRGRSESRGMWLRGKCPVFLQ